MIGSGKFKIDDYPISFGLVYVYSVLRSLPLWSTLVSSSVELLEIQMQG